MLTIDQINERVDLHDLANRLGLHRPGGQTGNYKSPHHQDKNPSLSIFPAKNGKGWKDHSTDRGGGPVQLVMYVQGLDLKEAINWLHRAYGWPIREARPKKNERMSKIEWKASTCRGEDQKAIDYLKGRGIPEEISKKALGTGSLGHTSWTNPKVEKGEIGHGGPALAAIVKSLEKGNVVAVDLRFTDPEAFEGGKRKTKTDGEKDRHPWFIDRRELTSAKTIYIVESPINVLSIEACGLKRTAAIATRGISNAKNMPLEWLRGKRVILCMDNDQPDEKTKKRPGDEAAWTLLERLNTLKTSTMLVDQYGWEHNDCNDVLQAEGVDALRQRLQVLEPGIVPGLSTSLDKKKPGRSRLRLPDRDFGQYWRFACTEDHTTWIKKAHRENEHGEEIGPEIVDLCGFRIASLTRITIASSRSVLTGSRDLEGKSVFSATVQTPRHGPRMQRRVLSDEQFHSLDHWRRFGAIFNPYAFPRMLNILERAVHLGEQQAINIVGIGWKDGRPVVNQGPDCFFTEPEKQCPYSNLMFPSGPTTDAWSVIQAYQETFSDNAATIPLVWALGAHLKAFIGFWPHLVLQAEKGAGKDVLTLKMQSTIAMTNFSGQTVNTDFRRITSISNTTHPVGWAELSARDMRIIDAAVNQLQEAYQHNTTKRGSEMTEYLLCAPVMLVGEDVPVDSIITKTVRSELARKKQGPMLADDLPVFPVLEWLQFLVSHSRDQIRSIHKRAREVCSLACSAIPNINNAPRMIENYAGILAAWMLLAEFADIAPEQGGFQNDLLAQMNRHILETETQREPWVWIMEIFLSECSAGRVTHPWAVQMVKEPKSSYALPCLVVRPSHIMDHISTASHLREKAAGIPVKSAQIFKKQLLAAGVVVKERHDPSIKGQRVSHAMAIGVEILESKGLHVPTIGGPEGEY
ncbi:MAG: toprim domain-containing protein [Magnetococcales bacterium]|nr:toprim domain-containing protein [Magnetococcales bacterium]